MLGFVGFIIFSVTVVLYVLYSNKIYKIDSATKGSFLAAFSLLALAGLLWATTFLVSADYVPRVVFISDVVLLAASGFMLNIFFPLMKSTWRVVLAISIMAAVIYLRAFEYQSTAFVEGGLLHLNLTTAQSLLIGLPFLVIWLPASVKVAEKITSNPKLRSLRLPISFSFMLAVLLNGVFLSAKQTTIIITSFASIILVFIYLMGINRILGRVAQKARGVK